MAATSTTAFIPFVSKQSVMKRPCRHNNMFAHNTNSLCRRRRKTIMTANQQDDETVLSRSRTDATTTAPSSVINDDELIQMQHELSTSLQGKKTNEQDTNHQEEEEEENKMQQQTKFLQHQKQVFDKMSSYFNSSDACPPEVKPLLHFIVSKFLMQIRENQLDQKKEEEEEKEKKVYKILDVGCGTGVLFPFYMDIANDMSSSSSSSKKKQDEEKVKLQITGVDLSSKMIACAKERAKLLLTPSSSSTRNESSNYQFEFVVNDFVSMILDESSGSNTMNDSNNNNNNQHVGKYDGVMVNACFGNFLDTDALMTALSRCVKIGGIACVAHPLGKEFVQRLHEEDSNTVPHNLPTENELGVLVENRHLKVLDFVSSIDLGCSEGNTDAREQETKQISIYYASSVRVET